MKIIINIILSILFFILTSVAGERTEINKKRNVNSKTYKNKDGSYTLQISSGYMHYKDTDSTWAEIDHNFKASPLPGYDYSVTEGLFHVHAKSDISQNNSVIFETADSLRLFSSVWGVAYLDIKSKKYKILQRTLSTKAEVVGNEILYRNVFSDVDIRYSYEDSKLKEEIYLSQAARDRLPRPSKFGFKPQDTYLVLITELQTDGKQMKCYANNRDITAVDFDTDKRIDFKSHKNKLKYFFPVDYAYMPSSGDSGRVAYEHKVRKRIIRKNGRRYLLAGVPLSWIKGLPQGTVIIDPTIQYNAPAVKDVWLENSGNKNSFNFLCIAKDTRYPGDTRYSKKRALIEFDLSGVPSTAVVSDAKLKVYYFGRSGTSWVNRPIRVYRMTKGWRESQATKTLAYSSGGWPSYWSGDWAEGDYDTNYSDEVTFTTAYGWKTFGVTNIVANWLGGGSNKGFILKATNEDESGYDVRVRSSEYSDANYRPKLEIKYEETNKLFYLKDHLGNIRVTINAKGAVVGYDDYYPFGKTMPQRNNNLANPNANYKYSGKELDEESLGPDYNLDWYYFGARYYDAEICIFRTVDPHDYNYPSLNPYHYVGNNPMSFIDPTGMDSVSAAAREAATQDASNEQPGERTAAASTALLHEILDRMEGEGISFEEAISSLVGDAVTAVTTALVSLIGLSPEKTEEIFGSRTAAFQQAKKDAGISVSQKPDFIEKVMMTDQKGKPILNANNKPIWTRQYIFEDAGIVIQDHSAGHKNYKNNPGSHFNIRPKSNTRTGKIKNTRRHYRFKKK